MKKIESEYINEYGDIRNNQSNKILHPKKDKDGYLTVTMCVNEIISERIHKHKSKRNHKFYFTDVSRTTSSTWAHSKKKEDRTVTNLINMVLKKYIEEYNKAKK